MIGGGFGFLVGLMMLTNMSIVNDAISEIEDIKSAKANLILAWSSGSILLDTNGHGLQIALICWESY
jgi:hypothetical protein